MATLVDSWTMTSGPPKGVHPFFTSLRNLEEAVDGQDSDSATRQPEQPSGGNPQELPAPAPSTQNEDLTYSTHGSHAHSHARPLQEQHANLSNSGSNKRPRLDVTASLGGGKPDIDSTATPTRSTKNPEAHDGHDCDEIETPRSGPKPAGTNLGQSELKLNGRGGFSTPKKQKTGAKATSKSGKIGQESGSKPSRGRPRKHSLVAILRYDHLHGDARRAFGQKIDEILTAAVKPHPSSEAPVAPLHTRPVNPSKPTHPFFSGKVERINAPPQETSPARASQAPGPLKVKSFTTPVKMERAPITTPFTKDSAPAFSLKPASHPKSTVSGMRNPLWPPRGFNQHRFSDLQEHAHRPSYLSSPDLKRRSQKQRPVCVPTEQDVIATLATRLVGPSSSDRSLSDYQFALPQRQLETQSSMKHKVRSELVRSEGCRSDDQGSSGTRDSRRILQNHKALEALCAKIGVGFTAFDRAVCDNQAWCVKHAPQKASHVLQTERETSILREWLVGLTIDAVERRLHEQSRSREGSRDRLEKIRRKRRKKAKGAEFDDFLVDSDEEGELSALQAEDEVSMSVDHDEPRTMVREALSRSAAGKTSNAMLISGPHGSGKTAAVFAVARELGFEVFEINSASRRSGKDILEKVGDMALNHQVRQRSSTAASLNDDPPPEVFPSQTTKLNSFFTSTSASKTTNTMKRKDEKPIRAAKKQTQALILLEEVDVLFDDDKQFWETVMTLAIQSRRPIIMTCEDESLLPLDELPLHAILRFRAPPVALAASSLLAMAAAEGHLISYDALSSLYQTKKRDLRASIMELQFRCQMAIGDDKGGLNWWLSRWPPGSDVDNEGQVLHVVSSGTVKNGTDLSAPRLGCDIQEVERLSSEGWFEYQIEPLGLAHRGLESLELQTRHASDPLQSLIEVEQFLDHLSDADTLGSVDLPTTEDEPVNTIDPSLPSLTDKDYHDHSVGRRLLQDDVTRDYHQLGPATRIAVSIQARRRLQRNNQTEPQAADQLYNSVQSELIAAIQSDRPSLSARQHDTARKTHAALEPLIDDESLLCSAALAPDIAPYVRTIVAYDLALEHHRSALSGPAGKQLRKTRASRSALEGGQRNVTRRDRWFGACADYARIMDSAGGMWPRCEGRVLAAQGRAGLGAGADEALERSSPAESV